MSKGIRKCQSFDIVRLEKRHTAAADVNGIMISMAWGSAGLPPPAYAPAIPRAALSSSYSL